MWFIFAIIITVYITAVFGLSRFVIPHLGFEPEKIPDNIPTGMLFEIERLKNESADAGEFLEKAWGFIGDQYHSERLNTVFKFGYLFKSPEEIWNMRGYIPCTQSSFLFRIFLVKSGFFREQDIIARHNFVNFCIHQYLRIWINDRWLDIDVGEKKRGMKLGQHLKWFG